MKRRTTSTTLFATVLLLSASSAWAHPGHPGAGFADGLLHPLLGLDHWLAMLGLGLWARAARVPRPAMATLAAALAIGTILPMARFAVEPLLAASVLAAGLMGLASMRLKPTLGLATAAAFGLVHGHAHRAEMATFAALSGAICMSLGLLALGLLLGRDDRLRTILPGIVAVAGAGLMALA